MQTVLTERQGAILTITLNRPDRLNALDEHMHAALRDGQHLGERARGGSDEPPDVGVTFGRRYNPLVRALRTCPAPVVAAVNGVAAGAAMNLALACDIVLAARSAVFLQPFANLGLVPDAGGTFTLPRAVGAPRARAMAMLAD